MNTVIPILKRLASPVLATAALAAFTQGTAQAVPTLDGNRDAEYVLVSSPNPAQDVANNLVQDGAINDEADPRARTMDVAKVYAANTSTALYLYIELPKLDLDTVYGDWTVLMHLGGANDSKAVASLSRDPYADTIFLGYDMAGQPMPNAAIKANFRSSAAANQDGMNGWSDLVLVNSTNGWDYGDTAGTRNYFGVHNNAQLAPGTTIVSGTGSTGASIVYLENAGIELMAPLATFGMNPNSSVVAPVVGDTIKLQFVATTRRGGPTNANDHLRGAIDSFPYDPSARVDPDVPGDYSRGLARVYGTYTLSQPTTFEVTGGAYRDATHLVVNFSDPVSAATVAASDFSVVDTGNSATINVTAAEVNPSDNKQVILTTGALPVGRTILITVTGVQNTSGVGISSTKNTAQFALPTPVIFRLYDPGNLVAGRQVTLTGTFTNWANNGDGTVNPGEILMNPVSGQPNRYESAVVVVPSGPIAYKYRVPSDPNPWNLLNQNDRTATVPVQETNYIVNDTVLTPVPVTFRLYDPDNLANGAQITVTGSFTGWANNGDGTINPGEILMKPVSGQPNTYQSDPVNVIPDLTSGEITYKYRIPSLGGNTAWDTLNYAGPPDRRAIVPVGSPPVTTNDIVPNATSVELTFRLVDAEGRSAGKPIFVVGRFQNWTGDPLAAVKLDPVPGQPNTYQGTTSTTQGYTTYKYVTIEEDPNNIGMYIVNWDLFGQNDRFTNIIGSGSPLAQLVTDTIGVVTPPAVRILRIAGGLEAAPSSLTGLDRNGDSQVTILDAVAAAKGL